MSGEQEMLSPLVITSGDEGVQLNSGVRFAFVGSGYDLPYFPQALKALQKLFKQDFVLASVQEDDWMAKKLSSRNPNLYQTTLEKLAKKNKLAYVGQFDYGDPRDLNDSSTRGHIVRPQKIHVADQVIFTLGGGEQNFNLRKFVISADYVANLPIAQAEAIIKAQVDFYQTLTKKPLNFSYETEGSLDEKTKVANQAIIEKMIASWS
ncbi:MAG: hypothetical protein Q4G02_01150 [bacterium]|nr:hypothetical protein [bacterium]